MAFPTLHLQMSTLGIHLPVQSGEAGFSTLCLQRNSQGMCLQVQRGPVLQRDSQVACLQVMEPLAGFPLADAGHDSLQGIPWACLSHSLTPGTACKPGGGSPLCACPGCCATHIHAAAVQLGAQHPGLSSCRIRSPPKSPGSSKSLTLWDSGPG